MNAAHLMHDLEQDLGNVPMIDVHTHLVGGKLGARGLHDVLLYHMVISDLHAAGCPSGARLTEYPGWPTDEEARARIEEALPYLPRIRNTSSSWGVRIILGDLYDWHEPITADNWKRLDAIVRERADNRATQRVIRTLDDVHAAVGHYVNHIPYSQVLAVATHISTDIDFRPVNDRQMTEALARRRHAGPDERDVYASYVNEAFLTALESRGERITFQFSFGAEPLPYETGSRLLQRSIAQLAEMVGRHSGLPFQCFLASRHANQSLCTLARELPNLSLAGYWWHNFFPNVIRQVVAERLDMLPLNRQVGFFSDAYCVEWTYAKAVLVRKQLAHVLAVKIFQGQYTRDEAISTARAILYETPQSLLGMVPRSGV